jgi:hypothetical protein
MRIWKLGLVTLVIIVCILLAALWSDVRACWACIGGRHSHNRLTWGGLPLAPTNAATIRSVRLTNQGADVLSFSKVGLFSALNDATGNRPDWIEQHKTSVQCYTIGIVDIKGSMLDMESSAPQSYDTVSSDHYVALYPSTSLVIDLNADVPVTVVRMGKVHSKLATTAPAQRRLLVETSTNYTDIAKATFTKGFVRLRPGQSNGTGSTQPDSYIGPNGIYDYAAKSSDLPPLSPTPVPDGLVLLLDAGDAASYSGTGTTWTDLSGKGNTGTLKGPTYRRENGGTIVFDGSDDYVEGPIQPSVFSGPHTICCWFWHTAKATWSGLFSNNVGTDGSSILTFINRSDKVGVNQVGANSESIAVDLGADHLNQWLYAVVSYAGVTTGSTVSVYAYKKGALLSTSGPLYWNMRSSASYIVGCHYSGNHFHNGYIAHVAVYNRVLAAAEIEQNYNALCGRFGLPPTANAGATASVALTTTPTPTVATSALYRVFWPAGREGNSLSNFCNAMWDETIEPFGFTTHPVVLTTYPSLQQIATYWIKYVDLTMYVWNDGTPIDVASFPTKFGAVGPCFSPSYYNVTFPYHAYQIMTPPAWRARYYFETCLDFKWGYSVPTYANRIAMCLDNDLQGNGDQTPNNPTPVFDYHNQNGTTWKLWGYPNKNYNTAERVLIGTFSTANCTRSRGKYKWTALSWPSGQFFTHYLWQPSTYAGPSTWRSCPPILGM